MKKPAIITNCDIFMTATRMYIAIQLMSKKVILGQAEKIQKL